jgi:hypothetical protein
VTKEDILKQHATFYESLIEHPDSPGAEASTVAAAVLALAQIMSGPNIPKVEITRFSDEKES